MSIIATIRDYLFSPPLSSIKARAKETDRQLGVFIRTKRTEAKILTAGIDQACRERDAVNIAAAEAEKLKEQNNRLL